MSSKFKLLIIIFCLLGLLFGAAVVLDSRRVIRNAYEDARDIDRDIERFEHDAINAAAALGAITPTPAPRLLSPPQRQADFDEWYSHAVSNLKIDPADSVKRPLADQMSGAINRRRIALPKFNQAWAEYEKIQSGTRGTIARLLGNPIDQ